MCMDGPSDPESEMDTVEEATTLPPPSSRPPTLLVPPGCAHLARRDAYVYVNRTPAYCAPRYEFLEKAGKCIEIVRKNLSKS